MNLHIETHGHGPSLALVHGWAMHGGLFMPLVEQLADRYTLHLVDLQVPDAALNQVVDLHVTARWLACADACVPERADLVLGRDVAPAPQRDEPVSAQFAAARNANEGVLH